MLKHEIAGLIAVNPAGGKKDRAHAVSPQIEAGNVHLPDPSIAPWIDGFIDECAAFPNAKYDDQVDAFMLFLDWFSQNEPNINMTWPKPIGITRADMGMPLIKDWSYRY